VDLPDEVSSKTVLSSSQDELEGLNEQQLLAKKEQAKDMLQQMVYSKDRLTVHAFVLRLCLANGLLMYPS
jgi:hypothetical protein